MYHWEQLLIAVAAITWALHRWAWPRWAPRLAAAAQKRFPELWKRARALAERKHAGLVLDWVLAGVCLLVAGGVLWSVWSALAPNSGPSGPDHPYYMGSALAFETGDWSLYHDDRYPSFPWLVSLLAGDPYDVVLLGCRFSELVTIAAVLPLYWIGRLLGGRSAGVIGALVAAFQPLVIDTGHTYTPYPLIATLDAGLLALGMVQVRRGALWPAVVMGLLGALAIGADPKQIPLVLMAFAICGGWHLLRSKKPWWQRIAVLAVLGLPLVTTQLLVGAYVPELMSLEGITARTTLNFTGDAIEQHVHDGFSLGAPDAWRKLLPAFARIAANVAPPEGHAVDPCFLESMPLVYPRTSPHWAALILALPLLALFRARMRRGRLAAVALLLLTGLMASSTIRLRYTNRYAMAHGLLVPTAIASTMGMLLGGPAVAAAGAVALLHPECWASHRDTRFLHTRSRNADLWAMGERADTVFLLQWAMQNLPQDATIYDFSESRPMITLAAGAPYVRCTQQHDMCNSAIEADQGTLIALLRANEFISSEVPEGKRLKIVASKEMPPQVGDCWTWLKAVEERAALYQWNCEERPRAWRTPRDRPPSPKELRLRAEREAAQQASELD